jgi:hypothetical protein
MLRREVMKLGGLFGLGAGTPSRFPYPDRPQPSPGLGPSAGQNIRARVVVVFGPAGSVSGVFVYSPGTTPGPGNPPIAAMSASATDPFGNDITPGDASSLGTIIAIGATPSGGTPSFIQLAPATPSAQINIGSGDPLEAVAAHIDSLISGGGASRNLNLRLTSPKAVGFPNAAASMFLASEAVDGSASPLWLVSATDGVNSSSFEVTPTGTNAIVGPFKSTAGSAASPSLISTDVWSSLGSPAIANVTVNQARYALMPFGANAVAMMCIDVALTATGAVAAGVYTFANTLPAGPPNYQFPGTYTRSFPVGFNGTITTATNNANLLVDGAGQPAPGRVRLQIPALPINTSISVTCFIPLN